MTGGQNLGSQQGDMKRHIVAVHEGKKLHKCLLCKPHVVKVHEGKKSHKRLK